MCKLKSTLFRKEVILTLLLFYKVFSFAQSPVNIPFTYTIISSGTTTMSISPPDSSNWYRWQVNQTDVVFSLKLNSINGKRTVEGMKVYVEDSGQLNHIIQDTLQADSTVNLFARNLTIGSYIYLNLTTKISCSGCSSVPPTTLLKLSPSAGCTSISQPPCELVKDGSAEYFSSSCSQLRSTIPFYACYWYLPNSPAMVGTSDYFNTCAPLPPSLPYANSVNANQNFESMCQSGVGPRTGNGYLGAYLYSATSEGREYLVNKLAGPMLAGKTYSISMYVKLSHASKYATQNIQMLLCNSTPVQTTVALNPPPNNYASVINTPTATTQFVNTFTTSPVTDKNNWTLLKAIVTATNTWDQIAIGNFRLNAQTGITDLDPSNSWTYSYPNQPNNCSEHEKRSYYYFDDISIRPLEIGAGSDQSICYGQSTVLTATNNCLPAGSSVTYSWTPGTGLSSTNTVSTTATPTVSTNYTVTATLVAGTSTTTISDVINVNVYNSPTFTLTANASPNPVCLGSGITSTLSTNAGANISYTWTNGTNTFTTPNPTVIVNSTTTYTVYTNACSQYNSASVTITVNPSPNFTVTPINPCINSSVQVIAPPLTTISSINFGDQGSYSNFVNPHTYTNTGTYSITVNGNYSASNCITHTVIPITIANYTTPVISYTPQPCSYTYSISGNLGCYDNNYVEYYFDIFNSSGTAISSYSATGITTFTYSFPGPGTYTIKLIDNMTLIQSSVTLTVSGLSMPIYASATPTALCSGQSSTLTANGATSYTWQPGNTTGAALVVTPSVTTIYTVTGNSGSCSGTKTVQVTVVGPPSVSITNTTTSICGGQATFTAVATPSAGASYNWIIKDMFGNALSVPGTGTTSAIASYSFTNTFQNVNVFCTVTNSLGCSTTKSVTLLSCCYHEPAKPVYSNTTFTANTTISGSNIIMGGTITVNSGVTLNINSTEITFDPYTKIVLQNNAKININSSYLHACNAMWDGISCPGTSASTITISNSRLYDAINGIVDNGNSTIIADRNWFNKNYKSIVINNAKSSSSSFSSKNNLYTSAQLPAPSPSNYYVPPVMASLSNTAALSNYTQDYLMPPYQGTKPWAGIQLYNATQAGAINNMIAIGTTTAGVENVFDKVKMGIQVIRSNAMVQNNVFMNITGASTEQIGGVYVYGMNSFGTTPNTQVGGVILSDNSMLTNNFINCDYGVYHTLKSALTVWKNNFTSQQKAVYVTGNNANITASGSNSVNITQNKIYQSVTGIELYNNINVVADITDNRIDNSTPHAAATTDNNFAIRCTEATLSTNPNNYAAYNVFNNYVDNYYNGVWASQTYSTSIYDNEVYMRFHNVAWNFSRGINNAWGQSVKIDNNIVKHSTSCPNSMSWLNIGIFNDFTNLPLVKCNLVDGIGTCLTFQGPCYTLPGNGIYMNTLQNGGYGISMNGGAEIGDQYYTSGATNYSADNQFGSFTDYQTIVTGNSNLTSSSLVTGQSRIYNRSSAPYIITTFTPLVSTSGVGNPLIGFNSSNTTISCNTHTATTAKMASGPKLMQQGLNIAKDSLVYDTTYATTLRLHNRRSLLRNIKLQQIDTEHDDALTNFMQQASNENTGRFYTIDSLLTTADSTGYSTIAALNNAVNTANNSDAAQKHMNQLHVKYLNTKGNLSEQDISALETLAQKCPLEHGPAVNKARVMAYQFTHKQYFNACELTAPPTKNNKARMANNNIAANMVNVNVYPNPASNQLFVEADGYETLTIKLYTIIGELVIDKTISKNTSLDINNLSSGTYIYRVFNNGNILNTGKLIISK